MLIKTGKLLLKTIHDCPMEHEKITKKDKIVYGITLAVIFFGVLGVGLLGMVINLTS